MSDINAIDASADFSLRTLGDARLDKRLARIVRDLQARPDHSFPEALGSDAAAEAFYRLLANSKVEWRGLFDAHVQGTHARCCAAGRVLAIHDSSLFQFGGVREGAFATAKGKSGFLGHTCLAVSADGLRTPLGLLDMIPVVRLQGEEAERSPGTTYDNEAERWMDLVALVEDELPQKVSAVHVMDSEGDSYALLELMYGLGADFVVRLCHDRRVLGETGTERLEQALRRGATRLRRSVRLAARKEDRGEGVSKRHVPRDERDTTLEVRTLTLKIRRPAGSTAEHEFLPLNIVHVVEADAPEGAEPVSWVLATTLPIDTDEQVADVVDAYRARWLIEEWFKALKTGCAYQERQVESLEGLLTVFALLAPIATRLLALRWISRNEAARPASDVLTEPEIECLRILERGRNKVLPAQPTVSDVMMAIARIGGFLTQNKVAGWQVIGRGYEKFQTAFSMFLLMNGRAEEM